MPFQIIRNDITKVRADAIVNTANPYPTYGLGTDKAIYHAAGIEKLLAERRRIGRIAPGGAAATPAFDLPAKYIIHTVGPVWYGGIRGEYEVLSSCYRNSLNLAKKLGCESVAFPLISTGIYGFPKDRGLDTAIKEISAFLKEDDMDIILVVFDREAFGLSASLASDVRQFIGEHYVSERTEEEYTLSEGYAPGRKHGSDEGHSLAENYAHGKDYSLAENYAPGKDYNLAEDYEPDEDYSFAEDYELDEDYSFDEDNDSGKTSYFARQKRRRPSLDARESYDESLGDEEEPDDDDSEKRKSRTSKPSPAARRKKPIAPAPAFPAGEAVKRRSLRDLLARREESFQACLFRLIDEKGLKDTEVYKKANIDRRLFSKIRCDENYHPKKQTVLAFALALCLSLDETADLLRRAGFALSPCSRADLIVEFCIQNKYDIYTANSLLFEYEEPLLGA